MLSSGQNFLPNPPHKKGGFFVGTLIGNIGWGPSGGKHYVCRRSGLNLDTLKRVSVGAETEGIRGQNTPQRR